MTKTPKLPASERAAVLERDSFMCRRCGSTWSLTVHHRRPRSMGGTRRVDINGRANLVTLCGSGTTGCHGWVETNREASYALGWLVPSWANPVEWPICFAEGFWAQPGDSGWTRSARGTEWQEDQLTKIGARP